MVDAPPTTPNTLVIVGGGMAGLVAARRAALAGWHVTVVESGDRPGGMLRGARLGDLIIDIGAEAFAKRGGAVAELVRELGLGGRIVEPRSLGSWGVVEGDAYPFPPGGLLGIPSATDSPELRAVLGDEGVTELQERDQAPAATFAKAAVGASTNGDMLALSDLVRERCGDRVLDRLVTPVARGVYSIDPEFLDVRALLPGLRDRFVEAGSLTGAIAKLREQAPPGAAVQGLLGGMHALPPVLVRDIEANGGVIRVRTGALRAVRDDSTGLWHIDLDTGISLTAHALLSTVEPASIDTDLGEVRWVDELGVSEGDVDALSTLVGRRTLSIEVVALLVTSRALRDYPRGTGVLVGEPKPQVKAKALTHVSAKWPWLSERLERDEHVVRLSYSTDVPSDRSELIELATRDASALLGISIAPADVHDVARWTWRNPVPAARTGRAPRLAAARAAAGNLDRFAIAGTWIDGTGLASVIPGAERAVSELIKH